MGVDSELGNYILIAESIDLLWWLYRLEHSKVEIWLKMLIWIYFPLKFQEPIDHFLNHSIQNPNGHADLLCEVVLSKLCCSTVWVVEYQSCFSENDNLSFFEGHCKIFPPRASTLDVSNHLVYIVQHLGQGDKKGMVSIWFLGGL